MGNAEFGMRNRGCARTGCEVVPAHEWGWVRGGTMVEGRESRVQGGLVERAAFRAGWRGLRV